jgi:hypothetical protein
VIVIGVPPATEPNAGKTETTVGGIGGIYENSAAGLATVLPLGVTTVICTWPAPEPGGLIARIRVSLSIWKIVAATVPKKTPVALLNPEPDMSTCVPPRRSPEIGRTVEI